MPNPTIGHTGRVYDQIFLDGTYTALWDRITAPLIGVIDGVHGAVSAIKNRWPTTTVQRCLVHAQRVARRYTTSRPRTDAGRTIYQLALKITHATTLDEASAWGAQLQQFHTLYRSWLNEKTVTKDPATGTWTREWTHPNVRKTHNSLNHLWRTNLLFVYRDQPDRILDPGRVKSTTNSLQGGINARIKELAYAHREWTNEHQRRMLYWLLYLKTELPDDSVRIARQFNWGQDQLAKVSTLTHNENHTDCETGRPALYDNAIPTEYEHSIGIRKGPMK